MADVQLGFVHYYHCTLTHVPLTLSLSRIPDCLLPHADSPVVRALTAMGCRLVPHQLHLYKEKLPYKFGYVTFLINHSTAATTTTTAAAKTTTAAADDAVPCTTATSTSGAVATATTADAAAAHALAVRWLTDELPGQLAVLSCRVQLAQPAECYSAEPFLIAFNHLCSIVDPARVTDSRRVETFVLSKVHFANDGRNAHVNELALRERHRRSMAEQLAEEEQQAQAHEAAAAAVRARHGSSTRSRSCSSTGSNSHNKSNNSGGGSGGLPRHAHARSDSDCHSNSGSDMPPAGPLTSPRQQHMHWMLTHWAPVGTLSVSALSAPEQAWLRAVLPDFPAPSTRGSSDDVGGGGGDGGGVAAATNATSASAPRCADGEAVRAYLEQCLAPLVLVTL